MLPSPLRIQMLMDAAIGVTCNAFRLQCRPWHRGPRGDAVAKALAWLSRAHRKLRQPQLLQQLLTRGETTAALGVLGLGSGLFSSMVRRDMELIWPHLQLQDGPDVANGSSDVQCHISTLFRLPLACVEDSAACDFTMGSNSADMLEELVPGMSLQHFHKVFAPGLLAFTNVASGGARARQAWGRPAFPAGTAGLLPLVVRL